MRFKPKKMVKDFFLTLIYVQFNNMCHLKIHGQEFWCIFGNSIELDTVGSQFKPYGWCPCGVTWDFGPKQQW